MITLINEDGSIRKGKYEYRNLHQLLNTLILIFEELELLKLELEDEEFGMKGFITAKEYHQMIAGMGYDTAKESFATYRYVVTPKTEDTLTILTLTRVSN